MAKYLSGTNPISPTKTDITWADLAGGKDILDKHMENRWIYCFKENGLVPYSEKQKTGAKMTTEQNMLDEIKDMKAKMYLAKAIAVSGDGFDTAIVPKGTFANIPEKIGNHKIFESPYIESGKIIFVNSDKINNYGY